MTAKPTLEEIARDLGAEHEELDAIVADLDAEGWRAPTPAVPWEVRDQISHLAYFDDKAALAAADPEAFAVELAEVATDVDAFVRRSVERARELSSHELLAWWRTARSELGSICVECDPRRPIVWYGPPMSPHSFFSARLMETWIHGQDIVDALGVERAATPRLRHIAHLGVRARPHSYRLRGKPLPDHDVRVELDGPDGRIWSWGDPRASQVVRGRALDFCLVIAQRRHLEDTDLEVSGELAREWMEIAQAFAGPPGAGRRPGQFPKRGAPPATEARSG